MTRLFELFYVYILECSDGSYYTGFTVNMDIRFLQHETGFYPDCYTYSRRPLKVVFCESFTDPNQGIAFEKQVKKWSRKKKQALIMGEWKLLPSLAMNKRNREEFKEEYEAAIKIISDFMEQSGQVKDL